MNCQSLAEAVASHYLKTLDSGRSHAENIRSHLHDTLVSTTRAVLLHGDEKWMTTRTIIMDDRSITSPELSDRLITMTYHDQESSIISGNELSERSVARMQAFLEGCVLALRQDVDDSVYDDTSNRRRKSSSQCDTSSFKKNTAIPLNSKKTDSQDSSDFYLTSALSGFSLDNSTTTATTSNKGSKRRLSQISSPALVTRLTLYFYTLRWVREVQKSIAREEWAITNSDGECVLAMESTPVMESYTTLLVQSFVATAGCVSSMRMILTNLLSSLTMQLLAVSTLSPSMKTSIRDLVLAYEHLTCFASLAFLSTPKDSAETKLGPLVRNYLDYLRSEWKNCVSSCQLELFLSRSLDPHLRHTFKTIEFQSISHLLEVCRYHKESLENIPLATVGHSSSFSTHTDESSIKQALRDLRREVITVNGRIIPPVASLRELVKTLKSILNSRKFNLKESRIGYGTRVRTNNVDPELESSSPKNTDLSTTDESSETEYVSSGNEGDARGGSILAQDVIRRKKSNTIEAIDVMTRRLIVASSRSEKGGDAYFVVHDLFGDESVDIVQASQLTDPLLSWMRSGSLNPRGSIEFLVRLSSIVIKLHANFYVYPKNGRGETDPLIQLSTTTTETIFLKEIRVDECSRKVMLTENPNMNTTARKNLAIRPGKYQRVLENGFLPN